MMVRLQLLVFMLVRKPVLFSIKSLGVQSTNAVDVIWESKERTIILLSMWMF